MKRYTIIPIFLLLAGCSNIMILDPKSTTGKEQSFLIWLSLAIMTIVLIVVFVLFTHFVIKYRYTKQKEHVKPIDVKGNLKLELTWIIIPIILLIILAVPTVKITYNQSPSIEAKDDLEGVHIQVTAQQFLWVFEHENGKDVDGELVIPEGETIIFHLESNDVIHSFWIPELAGKVDVNPGQTTIYEIKNPEIGAYKGKCAEYCGIQHTNMVFDVKVVPMSEYKSYLGSTES